MKQISVEHVERVAHKAAIKLMEWDEPTPDFSTRNPGILEGLLANTFQTFDGRDLYPSLVDKAAIMFYTIIKDHPFQNGNKRVAVTSLLVFLALNGKWLNASEEELYDLAFDVAQTKPKFKDGVVYVTAKSIKSHLIEFR